METVLRFTVTVTVTAGIGCVWSSIRLTGVGVGEKRQRESASLRTKLINTAGPAPSVPVTSSSTKHLLGIHTEPTAEKRKRRCLVLKDISEVDRVGS